MDGGMTAVRGVLEFAVYGEDLVALERFYCDVFGLTVIRRVDDRLTALRCGNTTVLLFDPRVSRVPGIIPEHGSTGAGHLAFIIEDHERDAWRDRLLRHGVEIEREMTWAEGGASLYVRDPAGNSVELAPPSLWGGLGRALLDSLR
jgi:catechol 2,3-dioxygenase-like lactoylglutathione lyase family enzyme